MIDSVGGLTKRISGLDLKESDERTNEIVV
jgi:hypothetical protein